MDAPRTRAGPRGASSPPKAHPLLSSWVLVVLRRPLRNLFRLGGSRPRDGRGGGAYPGALADETSRGEGPLILSECSERQEDPLSSLKADRGASSSESASGAAILSTCLDTLPQEAVEELSETDDRSKAAARVLPMLPLFVAAASTFSPPTDRPAGGEEVADSSGATNEETPRTDTSSCDGAGGRHLPLVVPHKLNSLPEEAPIQNAPSAQASEDPLISRIAQLLVCCGCVKSYTHEGAPQADLEREGASRQEAVEQSSDSAHAGPFVYRQFVLHRPPGGHQTRPSQAAAKKKGVAFNPTLLTRRSLLPRPTVASPPPPPFEERTEQQASKSSQHQLNVGPIVQAQGVPPAPEASACCPWVLLSCFSLEKREELSISFRPSGRTARGLSSSWPHSPQQEAWGPHRSTSVVGAPRAQCLHRLRDEQRQRWMEYQEVVIEDNSKRRQWVDVGDELVKREKQDV